MSQIYKTVSSAPAVPTSFVTDSGTAVPAANVLNVVTPGGGTQGITTTGAGSTITIQLTETLNTGTVTTVGAASGVLNFNVPVPNNSMTSIRANIAGFDSVNGLGVAAELLSGMKNVLGVLTIVGLADSTINADGALVGCSFTVVSSGTNMQVQITGVAGHTIDWKGLIETVNVS